jgi:hypothetical protein
VLCSEHAWSNPEGESGFLDLALVNRFGTAVLVVECKRVQEDAHWIFLQPGQWVVSRTHATAWVTNSHSRPASTPFQTFNWSDVRLHPASPEAEYCVPSGGGQSLEHLARSLVSATEGIAREEGRWLPDGSLRIYFSVIVTTAKLHVSVFDPAKITLKDGKVADAQYEEASFVRFRKQLSTAVPEHAPPPPPRGATLAWGKERTVFVVNSEALIAFLRDFTVTNESLAPLLRS